MLLFQVFDFFSDQIGEWVDSLFAFWVHPCLSICDVETDCVFCFGGTVVRSTCKIAADWNYKLQISPLPNFVPRDLFIFQVVFSNFDVMCDASD